MEQKTGEKISQNRKQCLLTSVKFWIHVNFCFHFHFSHFNLSVFFRFLTLFHFHIQKIQLLKIHFVLTSMKHFMSALLENNYIGAVFNPKYQNKNDIDEKFTSALLQNNYIGVIFCPNKRIKITLIIHLCWINYKKICHCCWCTAKYKLNTTYINI